MDYGTPVEVMVAQGGGQVVEAGYANMCSPEHVEMMISEKQRYSIHQKPSYRAKKYADGGKAVKVAQRHKVPLIVDAAAEEDLLNTPKQALIW